MAIESADELLGSHKGNQEYWLMLQNSGKDDAAPRPSVHEIEVYFQGLRTHEATMLFVISGDTKALNEHAMELRSLKRDRFFSDNFRNACKSVLENVHKIKTQAGAAGVPHSRNRTVAKIL